MKICKNSKLIFTLFLFWPTIYFSISSIFGFAIEDGSSPPWYIPCLILFGTMSVLMTLSDGMKFIANDIIFTIIFPLFIIMEYIIELALGHTPAFQYFSYYLGFFIPSAFIGVYIAKTGGIKKYTKWLDLVMVLSTLGLIVALPKIVYLSVISLGGASYQQMAYVAGLAFTINLSGLLFGDNYDRFAFMKGFNAKVICFIMLIVQLLCCLYSGGRGGFIYLVGCSIVLLVLSRKIMYLFYVVLFLAVLYLISSIYDESIFADVISERMERTFSFIGTHGIDKQNRGEVWDDAVLLFQESSLFGRGLFSYFNEMRVRFDQPYAHNLFLEILIQGGINYILVWIFILLKFSSSLIKLIKRDLGNVAMIVLFLFPFITLMFSTTYLQSSLFWFSLSYVYAAYKIDSTTDMPQQINY